MPHLRVALFAGPLLAGALLLPRSVAVQARAPSALVAHRLAAQTANLFELRDARAQVRISYATSSISGQPQLSYQDARLHRTFHGAEIRTARSEIGAQVTVTLEVVPDLRTVTLTLLLPDINLQPAQAPFTTIGIVTTLRTTIGGPALVKGAVQSYRTLTLQGLARAVVF